MSGEIGKVLILIGVLAVAGCASAHPVLYPNDRLRAVGQAQADADLAQCRSWPRPPAPRAARA
ncbi:MAG: hypothetical protein ACREJ5_08315, partial [Geminicoccaceae bacterium]